MEIKDIMTGRVVTIDPGESVEVAARTMTHYNIGALPVCSSDGKLCGMVTDRDLVIRCVASGQSPAQMAVKDVMTKQVVAAQPDMECGVAAHLMGRMQVRRLPVLENGTLCGMVSLGDLAGDEESCTDAGEALSIISSNIASGRPR